MESNMNYIEIIYNHLSNVYDIITYLKSDANFDYSELISVEQELKNPGFLKFKRGEKIEYNFRHAPIHIDLRQYSEYLTLRDNPSFETDQTKRNFSNNVFRFYKDKLSEKENDDKYPFNYDFFLMLNQKYCHYFSRFYIKEDLHIFNKHYMFLNIMKYMYLLYVRVEETRIYDFCENVNCDFRMIILYLFVNFNMKNKNMEKYIFSDIVYILNHMKSLSPNHRNTLNLILILLCCIYSKYYLFENMINLTEDIFNYSFEQSADYLFNVFEGNVPRSFFCEKNLLKYFFMNKSFQDFVYKFSYKSFEADVTMENCLNLLQKDRYFNINTKICDVNFTFTKRQKQFLSGLSKNLQVFNEIYFDSSLNKAAIILNETSVKLSSILPNFENNYFVINFNRNIDNFFSANILIPVGRRKLFYFLFEFSLTLIVQFIPLFIFNRKQKLNSYSKQLPPYFFNILMPSSIEKVEYSLKHYFDQTKIALSVKCEHKFILEYMPFLVYHFNNIRRCFNSQNYSDDLNLHFILKVIINSDSLEKVKEEDLFESFSYLDNFVFKELLVLKIKVKITKPKGFDLLETLFHKLSSMNFSKTNLKFLEIKINFYNSCKLSVFLQNSQEECLFFLTNQNNNKLSGFQVKIFYYMLDLIQKTIAPKILSYNFPFDESFEINDEIKQFAAFGQKVSVNFLYKIKKLEFIRSLYVMYQIKFYELEITHILLSHVEKILQTLDFCKVQKVSIVCTEGYLNSLDKLERILSAIFSSKLLKTMNLKILFQRNRFDIEEMIEFYKGICTKYFDFTKFVEISIIRGTIDAFSIPFYSEYKKYFNYPILTKTSEIDFEYTEKHLSNRNSFMYKDVLSLFSIIDKEGMMKKLKRYSIKKVLSNFLINKVGLFVRFYKIEYK